MSWGLWDLCGKDAAKTWVIHTAGMFLVIFLQWNCNSNLNSTLPNKLQFCQDVIILLSPPSSNFLVVEAPFFFFFSPPGACISFTMYVATCSRGGKKLSAVNTFYNEENYIHFSSTKCETAQVKRGLSSPLSNETVLVFDSLKPQQCWECSK